MRSVFLSIGSNIQPEIHTPICVEHLKKNFDLAHLSSVYETEPVGPAGDKNFWNMAAEIRTDLDSKSLSDRIRKIEEKMGRVRSGKNKFEPRIIDIDLLPQSDYQTFAFIVIPLSEIAPEQVDTESNKTFGQLAERLKKEAQRMRKIKSSAVFL